MGSFCWGMGGCGCGCWSGRVVASSRGAGCIDRAICTGVRGHSGCWFVWDVEVVAVIALFSFCDLSTFDIDIPAPPPNSVQSCIVSGIGCTSTSTEFGTALGLASTRHATHFTVLSIACAAKQQPCAQLDRATDRAHTCRHALHITASTTHVQMTVADSFTATRTPPSNVTRSPS